MRTIQQICGSSRLEGCTLLGALSVTMGVRNSITLVHGPGGCAHHNFSLLHATLQEQGYEEMPPLLSTDLAEEEIIFGGEPALEEAIRRAVGGKPDCVFVLSTCIVETIGDDVQAICRRGWEVPVIPVASSGFLGGGFEKGMVSALLTLARRTEAHEGWEGGIALIGEKNLESEVEENFREVSRLLAPLGERVVLRLARGCTLRDLGRLGGVRLNVLREPSLSMIGEELGRKFGTPYIPSFPVGFGGTIGFIRRAGELLGVDPGEAIAREEAYQQSCLHEFRDLKGREVRLDGKSVGEAYIVELMEALELAVSDRGAQVPIPVPPPVGTAGMRRMLHRWRRAIHAGMR